jgi:hypothetical protein
MAMMRRSLIRLALVGGVIALEARAGAGATEPEPRASPRLLCLPQSETREEVKARRLLEPFKVLKSASAQLKAEALSAKLCHIGDEFVYEIALLHRDGRFVHVVMNAATGKFVETRRSREPPPKSGPSGEDKQGKD